MWEIYLCKVGVDKIAGSQQRQGCKLKKIKHVASMSQSVCLFARLYKGIGTQNMQYLLVQHFTNNNQNSGSKHRRIHFIGHQQKAALSL